jgi:transcriptional regulator with XRE-family HTH domain
MRQAVLKKARLAAAWTQSETAARLGVSQSYYSQLESGVRSLPDTLALSLVKKLGLTPSSLPLPALDTAPPALDPENLAAALAGLGYPGFTHLTKARVKVNPAVLVARTLAHDDLETRLVEALPWVLAKYADLDWVWLSAQSRLLDLQNRLGFLLTLASRLAMTQGDDLEDALSLLEPSRLAREGTLCRESMSKAERNWVREHRSPDAAHWNLLTTLAVDQLTYAT